MDAVINALNNPSDRAFLLWVQASLDEFLAQRKRIQKDDLLLFPPLNSFYRMLVHKTVERFSAASISIGSGEERRAVACAFPTSRSPVLKYQDFLIKSCMAGRRLPPPKHYYGYNLSKAMQKKSVSQAPSSSATTTAQLESLTVNWDAEGDSPKVTTSSTPSSEKPKRPTIQYFVPKRKRLAEEEREKKKRAAEANKANKASNENNVKDNDSSNDSDAATPVANAPTSNSSETQLQDGPSVEHSFRFADWDSRVPMVEQLLSSKKEAELNGHEFKSGGCLTVLSQFAAPQAPQAQKTRSSVNHIVELSGFDSSYKEHDLLSLLADYTTFGGVQIRYFMCARRKMIFSYGKERLIRSAISTMPFVVPHGTISPLPSALLCPPLLTDGLTTRMLLLFSQTLS
eukprot:m.151546 g.151546  ORF g.151546 m.151546 type:complete len:400 (-) comp24512_c0_seq5:226-1425(-)